MQDPRQFQHLPETLALIIDFFQQFITCFFIFCLFYQFFKAQRAQLHRHTVSGRIAMIERQGGGNSKLQSGSDNSVRSPLQIDELVAPILLY